MSVTLLNSLNDTPWQLAGFARICTKPVNTSLSSLCYFDKEKNSKTMTNLYKNGHWSVFEHCVFTYMIECSRACSLQLARHRHISRTEMSQRYVEIGHDNYVIPPGLTDDQQDELENALDCSFEDYSALLSLGVKPEDARFVLPEATKTRMIVTLNLRTLLELTEKRANNSGAQWEIRQLVRDMWTDVNPELKEIFKEELRWLDEPEDHPVD